MKKIMCYVLVLCMLFGMSVTVSADSLDEMQIVDTISALSDKQATAMKQKISEIEHSFEVDNLEVNETKLLHDCAGKVYTLTELSPSGYIIYNNGTSDFVEYSATAPSPYTDFYDHLIYLGPTEYYYIDNGYYIHTITGEKLELSECENVLKDYSTELSEYYESKATDTANLRNQTNSTAATNKYISGYKQIKNMISKSEMSYCSPTGTKGICGYVASAITLAWYDTYKNGKVIDDTTYTTYARGYKVFAGNPDAYTFSGTGYKMTLSYNLWHYCSPDPNDNGGSYPWTIRSTINDYLHNHREISSLTAYETLVPSTATMKDYVDLGKPAILFGKLSKTGTDKMDHAVTVYGYSGDSLIAHFGWENYSEVVVSGTWGGAVTIS